MAEQLYFVARPFQYGPENAWLDVGQVTPLLEQKNDKLMLDLGFFRKLDGRLKLHECGKCGAKFTDANNLNGHGQIRHEGLPPEKVHAEVIDAMQAAAARYPLNTDNNAASRGRRA